MKVPLEARTKDALLSELVDLLVQDQCVGNGPEVLRVVREREAVLSTGIGNGIAIPHGRSGACHALSLAAGVTKEPVPFDALDGEPVRLVFLLVGPEVEAGPHIKALSRISRLVRQPQLRESLAAASNEEEFFRALREAESA